MGGKFGEMSTWLNYTFQSFDFRARQGARPFYDLVASIATEAFGHVELVSATINTMLTGATPVDDGRAPEAALVGVKGVGGAPARVRAEIVDGRVPSTLGAWPIASTTSRRSSTGMRAGWFASSAASSPTWARR